MTRTIAIIDQARNGTTMLVGIYAILGIPMFGNHPMRMSYEDLDITEGLDDERVFAKEVAKRNAKYRKWGFKQPAAWRYAETMRKYLRDPLYLAIFKDPVTLSRRRYNGVVSVWHLQRVVEKYMWSLEGIVESELPVVFLSYHDAIVQPEQFVRYCAALAGITAPDNVIERAVQFIQPNLGAPDADYPPLEPWITCAT